MGLGAAIGGGLSAAGALAAANVQAGAAKDAAGAQVQAANIASNAQLQAAQLAANTEMNMFNTSQADLAPYNVYGQANLPLFTSFYQTAADQGGQAWNRAQDALPQAMTEANLVNTPGYKFNLSQGLRAVQNSNAAQGLGVSGAALQGAAQYATGLADNTYQNQFANQQTLYNDAYNQFTGKMASLSQIYQMIGAPVSVGENAAATSGNNAINVGNAIGGQQMAAGQGVANAATQAGIAQSAGITGSAQSIAGGITGATGSIGSALSILGMQNALNNNISVSNGGLPGAVNANGYNTGGWTNGGDE